MAGDSAGTLASNLTEAVATSTFTDTVVNTGFEGLTEQVEVFSQELQGYPREGNDYLVMSTGVASSAPGDPGTYATTKFTNGISIPSYSPDGYDANDVVTLEITFTVPNDAKGLAFDFKFATEESPTWLGDEYQDFFEAQLITNNGSNIENIALIDGQPVTVDVADTVANTPGGNSENPESPLPDPQDVIYNAVTDRQEVERSISQYQGEEITLRFRIADASDSLVDSAVFLDNLRYVGNVDPGYGRAKQAFEDFESAVNELLKSQIKGEAHFTAILYDEYGDNFLDTMTTYWGIKAGKEPKTSLDDETRTTFNSLIDEYNKNNKDNEFQFDSDRADALYRFYDDLRDELDEGTALPQLKDTVYEYYIGEGDNQNVILDFGNGDSFNDVLQEEFGIVGKLINDLKAASPPPGCIDLVIKAFTDLEKNYVSRAADIVRSKEKHAHEVADYEGQESLELHRMESEATVDGDGDATPNAVFTLSAITIAAAAAAGYASGYATKKCRGSYNRASNIEGIETSGLSVSGPRAWGSEHLAGIQNLGNFTDSVLQSVGTSTSSDTDSNDEVEPTAALATFAAKFKIGAKEATLDLAADRLELILQCAMLGRVEASMNLELSDAKEKEVEKIEGLKKLWCKIPIITDCSHEKSTVLRSEGTVTIENTGDLNNGLEWKPHFSTDHALFDGAERYPSGYEVQIEGNRDAILAPGEQETYDVTVDAPKGQGLTSGEVDIDLGVAPVSPDIPTPGISSLIPIGFCETDFYARQEASDTDRFKINDRSSTTNLTQTSVPEGETIEQTYSVMQDANSTVIELNYRNEPHYANLQVYDENGNLTGFDPSQDEGDPQEREEIPNSTYSGLDAGVRGREWVAIEGSHSELDVEVVVPEVATIDESPVGNTGDTTADDISVDVTVDGTDVPELDPSLSTSDEVIFGEFVCGEDFTGSFTVSETNGDNPLGQTTLSVSDFENNDGDTIAATLSEDEVSVGAGDTAIVSVEGTVPEVAGSEFTAEVTADSQNAGSATTTLVLEVPEIHLQEMSVDTEVADEVASGEPISVTATAVNDAVPVTAETMTVSLEGPDGVESTETVDLDLAKCESTPVTTELVLGTDLTAGGTEYVVTYEFTEADTQVTQTIELYDLGDADHSGDVGPLDASNILRDSQGLDPIGETFNPAAGAISGDEPSPFNAAQVLRLSQGLDPTVDWEVDTTLTITTGDK